MGVVVHALPVEAGRRGCAVSRVTSSLPSSHAVTDRGRESVTVSLQPSGHLHKSSADPLYWVVKTSLEG
jgi:hypothetical protein